MPCYNLREAYQHEDINIGWYPYKTIRVAKVTTKPSGGVIKARIDSGSGVALQSVRNPSCSNSPPRRAAVNGNVWVYTRDGAKTGWIEFDALAVEDRPWALQTQVDGPANMDFEAIRGICTRGGKNGCGLLSLTRPRMRVKVQDTYLRYSGHGTAKHYLHKGDEVKTLIVKAPQGYCFVEVLVAAGDGSARRGMRGWVAATALERT